MGGIQKQESDGRLRREIAQRLSVKTLDSMVFGQRMDFGEGESSCLAGHGACMTILTRIIIRQCSGRRFRYWNVAGSIGRS